MPPATIDSHHHLWKFNTEDYGWMSEEMNVLRRDYLPEEFAALTSAAGIDGVVTVQARQIVEETDWLLELAAEHDFIRGVVGWVPLIDEGAGDLLDKYRGAEKLKAIRHILHDEADDDYMLRDDFNRGIRALKPRDLVYDILIFERHLPQTLEFVDRHPGQVFVVDHIAKPRIRDNVISPWREGMMELGRRENIYCKVSGMVTEADWGAWTEEQLRPYFDAVLEAFGPARLMFGSDWPVCLLASEYARWVDIVRRAISGLSAEEQAMILGGTAAKAYRL